MRRPKNPNPRAGCDPDTGCCPTLTPNPDGSFTFNPGDGSPPIIIPKSCCPTLVDNGNRTYTFTRGDGSAPITIDARTDHPAATLTNIAAPFSWNPATQTGNIPRAPSLVQNADGSYSFTSGDGAPAVTIPKDCCPTLVRNADGSFTFTPGDGSAPITIPALPVDIHLVSGYYNPITNELVLTLSNGNLITVPVSALLPVITDETTVTGDGAATPLRAGALVANANGSFTWTAANGSSFTIPKDCCPTLVSNGDGTFTFTPGDGSAPITINTGGPLGAPTITFINGDLTITANGSSATAPLRGNLLQDLAGVNLGYLLPL